MLKPNSFSILLENNNNNVFYSGSVISGDECISLPETNNLNYVNNVNIFKLKIPLFEINNLLSTNTTISATNNNCVEFEANKTYIYYFSVDLGPYNLPSSFEGKKMSIRYKFKSFINRKNKFSQTLILPITILSSIPNYMKEYIKPDIFVLKNTFGLFRRETIQITVETKYRSNFAGGKFILDVNVKPLNTKSVQNISFKLIQKYTLNHYLINNNDDCCECDKQTVIENELSEFIYDNINNDNDNNNEENDELIKLKIPNNIPPSIFSSKLINLEYVIRVSGKVVWSNYLLSLDIPVQISTLNKTEMEVPNLLSNGEYIQPTFEVYESSVEDLLSNHHNEDYFDLNNINNINNQNTSNILNNVNHKRHSFSPSLFSSAGSISDDRSSSLLSQNINLHNNNNNSVMFNSNLKRKSVLFQPTYFNIQETNNMFHSRT